MVCTPFTSGGWGLGGRCACGRGLQADGADVAFDLVGVVVPAVARYVREVYAAEDKRNFDIVVHYAGRVARVLGGNDAGRFDVVAPEGKNAKKLSLNGEAVAEVAELLIAVEGLRVGYDLNAAFALLAKPILNRLLKRLKVSVIPEKINFINTD